MNIEAFRDYALRKPEVTEGLPFDDKVLVFKVADKLFALTDIDAFESINLKCDPEKAVELRERYRGISPGYHMNKKHWNTVKVDSDVPEKLLLELIDHSYLLVVKGLKKADRDRIESKLRQTRL